MPLQPNHSEPTLVAEPGLPSTFPIRFRMLGLPDIATAYLIRERLAVAIRDAGLAAVQGRALYYMHGFGARFSRKADCSISWAVDLRYRVDRLWARPPCGFGAVSY